MSQRAVSVRAVRETTGLRRFSAIVLVSLAGCGTATRAGSSVEYLPRIATTHVGQAEVYPDPIAVPDRDRANPPRDLKSAVDALVRSVPMSRAPSPEAQAACRLSGETTVSEAYVACLPFSCAALPERSRDAGCGYLVRLDEWIQGAWLGGQCRIEPFERPSALAAWFRARGVSDCQAMSVIVTFAFMQEALGIAWQEGPLIASGA